jgi:hypothetical protein
MEKFSMERMGDGRQDTWAEWKAAVLALSDDALHQYLEGVEGMTSSDVARFVARDAIILPQDWATTDDAKRAMLRFFEFKQNVLDRGRPGAALDSQEARAAALSPAEDARLK